MEFLKNFPQVKIEEKCLEDMKALSTRKYTIIKVVQAAHQQVDIKYGVCRAL